MRCSLWLQRWRAVRRWGRRTRPARLDRLLAGEFHNNAAVGRRRDKAVMLFCGNACERLEPVGIVCRAAGNRPVLHCGGNRIGNADIQFRSFVNGLFERSVDLRGQSSFHYAVIKDQASEVVRHRFHVTFSFFVRLWMYKPKEKGTFHEGKT